MTGWMVTSSRSSGERGMWRRLRFTIWTVSETAQRSPPSVFVAASGEVVMV